MSDSVAAQGKLPTNSLFSISFVLLVSYTALPVSDLRISICRLNDRQLTGLLRGLTLGLVIFRVKPDPLYDKLLVLRQVYSQWGSYFSPALTPLVG